MSYISRKNGKRKKNKVKKRLGRRKKKNEKSGRKETKESIHEEIFTFKV